MADRRTRAQKLAAMANQSVSPHEAEVARRKLDEMRKSAPRGNPMAAPPRERPQATYVHFGPDGIRVEVKNFSFRTASDAAAEYQAAVDNLREFFRQAQERKPFEGTFSGTTSFRVETDEERAERARRQKAYERWRKDNSEWGKPRPGVKYPRGGGGPY